MKTVTNRNQDKYLINWIGGKRLLRKKIAGLIPGDIGSYIEPFGGGAWVLFYKDRWAPVEGYNDLNSALYNMFKIVKYHPEEFVKEGLRRPFILAKHRPVDPAAIAEILNFVEKEKKDG